MSSHPYEPPKFISDASEYAEFKRKLERWSRITKVEKKKQAEVVLYHLEGHPSGIQEKIYTALGDEIVDKVDGLQKLIEYLDTIYAKDEMSDAWYKYKKFIQLKRTDQKPVNEFIADFEKAYAEAKRSGCEFSDTVLAFNLLEACCLSETDEKFVLTAVNFSSGKEKKDLLEQVKNSLKKFQCRDAFSVENNFGRLKFENEDALVSSVIEALVAKGWKPPTQQVGFRAPVNSSAHKKRKNPLGSDGRHLKCFQCQSEYHFLDKCDQRIDKDPIKTNKCVKCQSEYHLLDKYDQRIGNDPGKANQGSNAPKKRETVTMLSTLLEKPKELEYAMVNVVHENDNDEIVFVADKEEELCCLIEDTGCRGVLDSACSRSVAGMQWVAKYTSNLPSAIAKSLSLTPSNKVYQFGGGEKRKSQGCLKLPTLIGDKKVFISIDVVDAEIPLLIGSNSMEAADAVLDFGRYVAIFFEEEVDMLKVGSGHFCIK